MIILFLFKNLLLFNINSNGLYYSLILKCNKDKFNVLSNWSKKWLLYSHFNFLFNFIGFFDTQNNYFISPKLTSNFFIEILPNKILLYNFQKYIKELFLYIFNSKKDWSYFLPKNILHNKSIHIIDIQNKFHLNYFKKFYLDLINFIN
jgi:hypothetical protein